ncbi:MAG: FtsQ-type POTRA domain-containing protein [Candidatus Pacebacteria bacterium]|nr:FtsQ-type POTRA domain-containing protein [Candidatus Paceibacterota bacterium]
MVKRRSYKKTRRNIKKRKSFLKRKSFWIFVFSFLLGGAFVYALFFSGIFQVKEIKVSGNQKVLSEKLYDFIEPQVEKNLIVSKVKNIFLINAKNIENNILKSFSEIGQASLKRKFPNTLILEIIERKTLAIFCSILKQESEDSNVNNCFRVDNNGIAFERADANENQDLTVYFEKNNISLGEKVINEKNLQAISDIKKGLKEKLQININSFSILEEKLNVITSQGYEIFFNLQNNISDQIFNLELVLKEKISQEDMKNLEYIDLRFGNKVYFR